MAHLSVPVEDVVARVELDGLGVESDCDGEVSCLAGRVRLADLLQEDGLRVRHADNLQGKAENTFISH